MFLSQLHNWYLWNVRYLGEVLLRCKCCCCKHMDHMFVVSGPLIIHILDKVQVISDELDEFPFFQSANEQLTGILTNSLCRKVTMAIT